MEEFRKGDEKVIEDKGETGLVASRVKKFKRTPSIETISRARDTRAITFCQPAIAFLSILLIVFVALNCFQLICRFHSIELLFNRFEIVVNSITRRGDNDK
jgi:hypothetical protein